MDSYAVMGNPIQHSLSPQIHHLFAEQTQQKLVYEKILVPLDGLSAAIDAFQGKGGKGLNITLPFKQEAFALVGAYSERALLAGAVNTIRFHPDGSRFGDNTDGVGFVRDVVVNHHFPLRRKKIVILGAGGSVRGILKPILDEQPEEVVIINRSENKAVDLVNTFAPHGFVRVGSQRELAHRSFDLIINATSTSLQGESLDLPAGLLAESGGCYDLAYGKGAAPFLQWARAEHAAFLADGLGMLIEQAAESFYIWRGVRPSTQLAIVYN